MALDLHIDWWGFNRHSTLCIAAVSYSLNSIFIHLTWLFYLCKILLINFQRTTQYYYLRVLDLVSETMDKHCTTYAPVWSCDLCLSAALTPNSRLHSERPARTDQRKPNGLSANHSLLHPPHLIPHTSSTRTIGHNIVARAVYRLNFTIGTTSNYNINFIILPSQSYMLTCAFIYFLSSGTHLNCRITLLMVWNLWMNDLLESNCEIYLTVAESSGVGNHEFIENSIFDLNFILRSLLLF